MRFLKEVLAGPSITRIVFNLGVLSGVLALVDFVLSVLYVKGRKVLEVDDNDYVVQAFEALYLTSAFLSMVQFLSCILFVYGSITNKPRWFLPWLLVYTASFLIYIGVFCGASVAMYLGGQAPTSLEVLMRCVISAVLNVYFLMICFCVIPRVDMIDSDEEEKAKMSYYDCMLTGA